MEPTMIEQFMKQWVNKLAPLLVIRTYLEVTHPTDHLSQLEDTLRQVQVSSFNPNHYGGGSLLVFRSIDHFHSNQDEGIWLESELMTINL